MALKPLTRVSPAELWMKSVEFPSVWISREASLEMNVFMDAKFKCSFKKYKNERCIDRIEDTLPCIPFLPLFPLSQLGFPNICEGGKVSFAFRHFG